ncbi:Uncharacterised protein [uncultured Actinomyces sp.]|nr:Uncharacterised protein [uncultured Actinomyces sp.]
MTPVAGLGPSFVTVSVYVTDVPGVKPPAGTSVGSAIALTIAVLATPVKAQSWSLFVIAPGLSVTLEVRESS